MTDHLSLKWPDLIILDRDGVINHDSKNYIKSADEWQPIAGSLEAIAMFSNAGIPVGIATNQRGISLGLYDHQALEEMHAKMHALLADLKGQIHAIEFCIADDPAHPDRKPNPGMLLKIVESLPMPKDATIYFVGDKISDIEAALNAGVFPVLVRTGNGLTTESKLHTKAVQLEISIDDLPVFDNLAEFALKLSQSSPSKESAE